MQQDSRFIVLGVGLLAFFSFALPWKHTYSGIVLVNGPGWFTTLVLIGSLFILGLGILTLKGKPVNPRSITLGLLLCGLGPLLSVASITQINVRLIYKPQSEIPSDSSVDQNPQEDGTV